MIAVLVFVAAGQAASADTPREERLRAYEAQRLRVVPHAGTLYPPPSSVEEAYGPMAPVVVTSGFSVVQGQRELEELELARLTGDRALEELVLARQEELSFGASLPVAAVGLATLLGGGTWFWLADGGSDDRTYAASLAIGGAVIGALAFLAPKVTPKPVLSQSEAQLRAEQYNNRLRIELGLTPTELAEPPDSGAEAE